MYSGSKAKGRYVFFGRRGREGKRGTLCKTYTYSRWLLNRLDLQYLENFKMKKQDLNES